MNTIEEMNQCDLCGEYLTQQLIQRHYQSKHMEQLTELRQKHKSAQGFHQVEKELQNMTYREQVQSQLADPSISNAQIKDNIPKVLLEFHQKSQAIDREFYATQTTDLEKIREGIINSVDEAVDKYKTTLTRKLKEKFSCNKYMIAQQQIAQCIESINSNIQEQLNKPQSDSEKKDIDLKIVGNYKKLMTQYDNQHLRQKRYLYECLDTSIQNKLHQQLQELINISKSIDPEVQIVKTRQRSLEYPLNMNKQRVSDEYKENKKQMDQMKIIELETKFQNLNSSQIFHEESISIKTSNTRQIKQNMKPKVLEAFPIKQTDSKINKRQEKTIRKKQSSFCSDEEAQTQKPKLNNQKFKKPQDQKFKSNRQDESRSCLDTVPVKSLCASNQATVEQSENLKCRKRGRESQKQSELSLKLQKKRDLSEQEKCKRSKLKEEKLIKLINQNKPLTQEQYNKSFFYFSDTRKLIARSIDQGQSEYSKSEVLQTLEGKDKKIFGMLSLTMPKPCEDLCGTLTTENNGDLFPSQFHEPQMVSQQDILSPNENVMVVEGKDEEIILMFNHNKYEKGKNTVTQYLKETHPDNDIILTYEEKNELKENYSLCQYYCENKRAWFIFQIGGTYYESHSNCTRFSRNYALMPFWEQDKEDSSKTIISLRHFFIPQLRHPRHSCTTYIYNGNLYVMYGRGRVPNIKGKEGNGLEQDVSIIEWAPINELISYMQDSSLQEKDQKITQVDTKVIENPFKELQMAGSGSAGSFTRPIVFEDTHNTLFIFGGQQNAGRRISENRLYTLRIMDELDQEGSHGMIPTRAILEESDIIAPSNAPFSQTVQPNCRASLDNTKLTMINEVGSIMVFDKSTQAFEYHSKA